MQKIKPEKKYLESVRFFFSTLIQFSNLHDNMLFLSYFSFFFFIFLIKIQSDDQQIKMKFNQIFFVSSHKHTGKQIAAENMATTPVRWDKLSPTEFQQLQDLASCKY